MAELRRKPGPKRAKDLAVVIEARHGLHPDSFYSHAGCLTCRERCTWPSFSVSTPADVLPLGCLTRVVKRNPGLCFYNLYGRCSVAFDREGRDGMADGCVLDLTFLEDAFGHCAVGSRSQAELAFRRRNQSFRREAHRYVRQLQRHRASQENSGPRGPRAVNVLRRLARFLRSARKCPFESSSEIGTDSSISTILDWIAFDWDELSLAKY
jgi:hypothetical protein